MDFALNELKVSMIEKRVIRGKKNRIEEEEKAGNYRLVGVVIYGTHINTDHFFQWSSTPAIHGSRKTL